MNWHDLQRTIGYLFADTRNLEEAMTHPSYAAESAVDVAHYERLEFLGDAVLQIIVTELIFQAYPDAPEGQLTKMRATLTRASALAEFARALGLGQYMRLGKGEEQSGGHERESLLCDAFEALVGAMFLDADCELQPVRELMVELIGLDLLELESMVQQANPKGALQELLQKEHGQAPDYETLSVEGPDHAREFTVQVCLGNRILGTGTGPKRRSAQEQAALAALAVLQQEMNEEHS